MKKLLASFLISAFTVFSVVPPGYANPDLDQITHGSGRVTIDGNTYNFHQDTQKLIALFRSFNISENEITNILQPGADSAALFRILDSDPSKILGALNATGKLFLLNPNGIIFGQNAKVNVGGLVASTLNMSDSSFLNGKYDFQNPAGTTPGLVENRGSIYADEYVTLFGGAVRNSGQIETAKGGSVNLAAGNAGTMAIDGAGFVNVAVTEAVTEEMTDLDGNKITSQIDNTGSVKADGGVVKVTARGVEQAFDSIINHSGIIEANSFEDLLGEAVIDGGQEGVVLVDGKIDVSAAETGAKGGSAHVLGDKVALYGNAVVDASGDVGGGEILIGGDYQGLGIVENSSYTYVGNDVYLNADAGFEGDGGKVIIWSDKATKFYGTVSARGGLSAGNGGFVETSGKEYLEVNGALVDASALYGETGLWLLDPTNITIEDAATNQGAFDGGDPNTFTATNSNAVVNTVDIENSLNLGTDVTIITNSSKNQDGNITVDDQVEKTAGNDAVFTLSAENNIDVNADITSSSNKLGIVLTADSDDSGAGGISINGAQINTNGGDFSAEASDSILIGDSAASYIDTVGGSFTAVANKDNDTTGNFELLEGSILTDGGNSSVSGFNIIIDDQFGTGGGNFEATAIEDITIGDAAEGTVDTVGGAFTATADSDADGSGDFELMDGAVLTNGGDATISAVDVHFSDILNAGAGKLTVLNSNGGTIGIGDAVGTLTIDKTEFANITAGDVEIGDSTNDNITVNNLKAADTGNISGDFTFNATQAGKKVIFTGSSSEFFKGLTANAAGGIDVEADVEAGSTVNFDADTDNDGTSDLTILDGTTLDSNGNDINVDANDIIMNTSGAIDAGAGNLTINVSDGASIDLGVSGTGGMQIDKTELSNMTANNLTVGGTDSVITVDNVEIADTAGISGDVTLDATNNGASIEIKTASSFKNLTANADDGIAVNGDLTTTIGDLSLDGNSDNASDSNDKITIGADLTSAGSITLGDSAASDVVETTAAADLSAADEIDIQAVLTLGGNTSITTNGDAGDDITIAGAVDSDSAANAWDLTLNSGAMGDVDVQSAIGDTNRIGAFEVTTARDVALQGVSTKDSNIDITSTGSTLSLNGDLDAGTGDVDVDTSAEVSVTNDIDAANVTLQSSAGNVSVSGDVTASADVSYTSTTGNISHSGTTVAGAANTVTLSAAAGSVDGSGLIQAQAVDADAATGIGAVNALNLKATSVSADTTNGDVNIDNQSASTASFTSVTTGTGSVSIDQSGGGELEAVSVITTDGSIELTNTAGDIDAQSVSAGTSGDVELTTTTSGDIHIGSVSAVDDEAIITSAGNILGKTDDGVADLSAGDITLTTSGGDIRGATASESLDVAVSGVINTSTSGGAQQIDFIGGANLGLIDAGTGTLILETDSAFTDGNADDTNFIAGKLGLVSASGVGTSGDAIETIVSNLEGEGGTGGFFVSNTGALEIGNVDAAIDGISAAGDIQVTTASPMMITSDVTSTGGGDVTLAALGNDFDDDMTVSANVTATDGGNVTLAAGHDVILDAGSIVQTNGAGTGAVSIHAGEDLTDATFDQDGHFDGSILMNTASTVSSNGTVVLSAANDVLLSVVTAAGTAAVTAVDGGIFDNRTNEDVNVTATDITLISKEGVGTHLEDIDLDVDTITAETTGSGDINLANTGDVELADVKTFDGDITVSATGELTATSVESQKDENDNDISLTGASVVLTDVNAGSQGDVYIEATAGSVTDTASTSTVVADDLFVTATDAVSGTGFGLNTQVNNLEGSSGTGVFRVVNDGALTVGGVEGAESNAGVASAGGEIMVAALSPLTVDENISQSGTGRITLIANGASASDNLTINANIEHTGVPATDVAIDLIAGNDIRVASTSEITSTDGNIEMFAGANATAGSLHDLDGNANGSIELADGSFVQAADDVVLQARNNVLLSDVQAGVDAEILAQAGSILDNTLAETANLTAVDAALTAADGIGSSSAGDVDVDLTSLTLETTGSGDISISEKDALTLTSALVNDGSLDLVAGGALSVISVTSTTDSNSNDIRLTADSIAVTDIDAKTNGDVYLRADGGAITNAGGTITADDLELIADTGVGVSGTEMDTVVNNVVGDGGSGGFFVSNTGALFVGGVEDASVSGVSADGEIAITAASPLTVNEEINSNAGGDITLIADYDGGTDDDLTINADVSSNNGNGDITLVAGDTLTIDDAKVHADGTGDVYLYAGEDSDSALGLKDGSATGGIVMNGPAVLTAVETEDGNIIVSAPGDFAQGLLDADADRDGTAGNVTFDVDGNVTDNNAGDPNIIAGGVSGTVGGNFGTDSDRIQLAVSNFEFEADGVHVENDGALIIGGVDAGLNGVTAHGGGIGIYASSPLTLIESVTDDMGGNITLAAKGSTAADAFTLSSDAGTPADVIASGGNGNIVIVAGGDVDIEADSVVSAEGTGTVTVAAGKDFTLENLNVDGDEDADINMAAGSAFRTQEGDINLFAQRDANLTEINADSDAAGNIGDVSIEARYRDITDQNAAATNITAEKLLLVAGGKVGADGSELDTVVTEIAAESGEEAEGGFYISNTGDLTIDSVSDKDGIVVTGGEVEITNAGTITIEEDILTTGANDVRIEATGAGSDITMTALTEIATDSGDVLVRADDNIALASVNADRDLIDNKGTITITATNGAITDANGGNRNLLGEAAALRSATGIAIDANRLNTQVDEIAADGGSGGVFVENDGALTITTVTDYDGGTLTGISAAEDIKVFTSSPLTVDQDVITGLLGGTGDITLAALGGGAGDDLTVVDGVTITALSPNGDVTLVAGDSVSLGSGAGIVSAAGNVTVAAGVDFTNEDLNDAGSSNGNAVFGDSAYIASATGNIGISATNDVEMGDDSSVATGTGTLDVTAGNDFNMGERAMTNSGAGDTTISVGRDMTMDTDAMVQTTSGQINATIGRDLLMTAGSAIKSTSGNISVLAKRNIEAGLIDAGTGDVSVTAEEGQITDANGGDTNIGGNNAVLVGFLGIGEDAPGNTDHIDTAVNNLEADGGFGGVFIINDGALNIGDATASLNGISTELGDIEVYAASPLTVTESVVNNGLGDIELAALGTGTDDDLTLADGSSVTTAFGDITLAASDAVITQGSAAVNAQGQGTLTVAAGDDYTDETIDMDGNADGVLDMSSGSSFNTEDGNITIKSNSDATISVINADSDNDDVIVGDVVINSGGAVTDANGGTNNITADQLEITAVDGIGAAADALETQVNSFVASNTTAGGISVINTGALQIGNGVTGTVDGVTNSGTEDITILANSPLTVNQAVSDSAGNSIILAALGADADDNVTLNADVTATGGNGDVSVIAGNNLIMGNGVTVSAVNDGNASLISGEDYTDATLDQDGNASGDIIMGGNSVLSVDAGTALVDAADNITLGVVETGAGGTAKIIARNGAIFDGNGSAANITGDMLALSSNDGIGSFLDQLDTQVSVLEAHGGNGGVFVANTGALSLEDFDASIGNAGEAVTATGDDIYVTTQSPMTINDDVIQNGGLDISLVAFGSADTDDITLNADVLATGGAGDIFVVAGDDVIMNAGTQISADNNGEVEVIAGDDFSDFLIDFDGNTNGDIVMDATASINSEDGDISLGARDDIELALVDANSDNGSSAGDVYIYSDGDDLENTSITDANGAALNIVADELIVESDDGFGTDADRIETSVNELEAFIEDNGFFMENNQELVVGGVSSSFRGVEVEDGEIVLTADGRITVDEEISTESSDDILLASKGTTSDHDLEINADITSDGGNLLIAAGDSITIADGDEIDDNVIISTTGIGDIQILASEDLSDSESTFDEDGFAGGSITMASDDVWDTQSKILTEGGNVVLDADGDVLITQIDADSDNDDSGSQISLRSRSGDILTNNQGITDQKNLESQLLDVRADGTFGTDENRFVSEHDNMSVAAEVGTSGTGGFYLENTGGVIVTALNSYIQPNTLVSGITAADDIELVAASPITVNSAIESNMGGDILLAAKGSADTDDINLNANVSTTDGGGTGAGTVVIAAGDDVIIDSGVSVSAENGAVSIAAGADLTGDESDLTLDGNTDADVLIGDSASVTTNDANIGVTATNNIEMDEDAEVSTDNGDIVASAGNDVLLSGDRASIFADTSGSIDIDAGNDVILGGEETFVGTPDGNITVDAAANNVELSGDGSFILSELGNVGVNAGNDLLINGETSGIVAVEGDLTASAQRDIHVSGDFFSGMLVGTGNADIDAGRDFRVSGENAGVAVIEGNLDLDAVQDVIIDGEASALIVGIGNSDVNAGRDVTISGDDSAIVTFEGDTTVGAGTGNVTLSGETTGIFSATGNVDVDAGTDVILSGEESFIGTDEGNVDVDAQQNVTLSGEFSGIGAFTSGNVDVNAAAGDVTLSGEESEIFSEDGDVTVGAGANVILSGEETLIESVDGNVDVDAGTDVLLTGEDSEISSGNGTVDVNAAGNVILSGDFAQIFSAAGDVTVGAAAGNVTLSGEETLITSDDGDVDVDAGTDVLLSGELSEISSGNGNVDVDAGQDALLTGDNARIFTEGGFTTVTGTRNVELSDSTLIGNTTGGNVIVRATNQDVLMADGSAIESNDGDIFVSAGRHVELAVVDADADAAGAVGDAAIIAQTGAITDVNADDNNVNANDLELQSATGTATDGDRLETTVSLLAASNSTSGGIFVENTGALEIGTTSPITDKGAAVLTPGISGVSNAGGGDIKVFAASPITINNAVTNTGGGLIQIGARGVADADDLTVNANVTNTGGNIILTAGDDVTFGDNVIVSATGAGTATVIAGEDLSDSESVFNFDGNGDGVLQMAETSGIRTEIGDIFVLSTGNANISEINADSNSDLVRGDVELTSVNGSITDTNDATTPDTMNITGDNLSLSAGVNIGTLSNPIETDAFVITPVSSGSGGVFISNSGGNGTVLLQGANIGDGQLQFASTGDILLENNFVNGAAFITSQNNILGGPNTSTDDLTAIFMQLFAGGTIGTPEQALNLSFLLGDQGGLVLSSGAQNNGLSTNITGNISRDAVNFVGVSPGLSLFNNLVLGGQNVQAYGSSNSIVSLIALEHWMNLGRFGQETETIVPTLNLISYEQYQQLLELNIIEPEVLINLEIAQPDAVTA